MEYRNWWQGIWPADSANQGAWLAPVHPGENELNCLTEIICKYELNNLIGLP